MGLFKHTKDRKQSVAKPSTNLRHSIKNILIASMAGWIPNLICITGSQLGIIVVSGSQGASQAGLYFISYSIVTGMLAVMSVLQTIAYPALSGMSDGRKRFAWRMLKLTLIIILPVSSPIMFYSSDIIQIFGEQYLQSSSMLEILMLSVLPTSVAGFISILVYSYGNYKQVLAIGLSINIPRVALYFMLVPFYGGHGGAISFVLGSVGGLLASILIARKIKMRLLWLDLTLLFIIPTALSFILSYSGINYIFGIIVTIIGSYSLFLRFKILDRTDLLDTLSYSSPKGKKSKTRQFTDSVSKENKPFFLGIGRG